MISIIIPAFNEEHQLPFLIKHLEGASSGLVSEIIVVDGGSTDNTAEVVKNMDGVILVSSEKGRAVQMNAGANIATSGILYFLHADSFPPQNFDKLILQEIQKGKMAGCFQMKFDKAHWWLKLMGLFTKFNHISCRGGDQSLFVERSLFKKLNGFNENYKVYEDNDMVRRLYEVTHFTVIKQWITTSARLYERLGVWQTQLLFIEIYWKKRFGASADDLYRHYSQRVSD
ncbi:TIGR04283 family arsenosugar biosynthesis glycosyltransferase [Christiangramia aquimixticola]|uniref:TIGR04283 family arsenosugar biosynthesis glycosyltransferase n=1 Tax=Christiangramia aquimixticola TaxID=1697558 RepID=UPI003AA804F5